MHQSYTDKKLNFTAGDLQILQQCGVSLQEVFKKATPRADIAPLWSVLSYAMYRADGAPVEGIWACYRRLRRIQQRANRYYNYRLIPKSSGDLRTIFIPNPLLRDEQAVIFSYILKNLPVSSHAYAYRKGVSMKLCAQPHVGQDVLIHLDIRDFFGSITEQMVYDMLLRETGYQKSLCHFITKLCCYYGKLPQGVCTSPILSNLVFRPCDEELAEIAARHQLQYTRYSDDLYFSGSADTDVGAVISAVSELLAQYGFTLNREKTKIRRQQHRQTVLGLTVNDHLQTSRSYRKQLDKELYYLKKFDRNCTGAKQAGNFVAYLQQLFGRVSYALQTDPENKKLREYHLYLSLRLSIYCID